MKPKKIAVLGIMIALAIVLSIAESFLSPVISVPGVKLGLSNIVSMFVFYEWGFLSSLAVVAVKSAFVLLSRGAVAFSLSLGAGVMSITVIALLFYVLKKKMTYLLLSVSGAIVHNMVQLSLIYLWYGMNLFPYYAPVFVLFGVVTGSLTAYLLKISTPILRRSL